MSLVPRRRPHSGWMLMFSGFRPLFLLGAIFAAVAAMLWLLVFEDEMRLNTVMAPRDWHVHEMLFGYLPTVITGFLITAISNCTWRLGKPLLMLVIVWSLDRRAALYRQFSDDRLLAMLVDTCYCCWWR